MGVQFPPPQPTNMNNFFNKTQKDRVKARIEDVGYVDNFWAIANYILRLGAIILQLKKEGYIFETAWGEGKEKKNFHYYSMKHCDKTLLGYAKKPSNYGSRL